MKNRALKGLVSLVLALFIAQAAFGNVASGAGQLLRKLFSQTDFVAKQTLRLSDDVAGEFMGNITLVKQLLSNFEGADDAAKATNFIKSIKSSVDADDVSRYDQLAKLASENGLSETEARELHDLLDLRCGVRQPLADLLHVAALLH